MAVWGKRQRTSERQRKMNEVLKSLPRSEKLESNGDQRNNGMVIGRRGFCGQSFSGKSTLGSRISFLLRRVPRKTGDLDPPL